VRAHVEDRVRGPVRLYCLGYCSVLHLLFATVTDLPRQVVRTNGGPGAEGPSVQMSAVLRGQVPSLRPPSTVIVSRMRVRTGAADMGHGYVRSWSGDVSASESETKCMEQPDRLRARLRAHSENGSPETTVSEGPTSKAMR